MKNKLLLFSALITALPALAVDEGQEMTSGVHGNGSNIFPHFSNEGGASSPVVHSRLIAKTVLFYNGSKFVPIDSTTYIFDPGSGRGGYTKPDAPNVDERVYFDHSYTYKWDKIGEYYINEMHRSQKYNIDNQVTELIYQSWKPTSSLWKDSTKYIYTYQNGLMSSSLLQLYIGGWTSHGAPSAMYYSGNRMTQMVSPHYKIDFTYNSANQLVETKDQEVVNGIWVYNEKHIYTYAGNNLKTHTLELYDVQSGQWVATKLLEYEYDNNNRVLTLTEKKWDGSAYANKQKNDFTYDAQNNKATDILSEWDGSSFQYKMKENWVYNSSNQVTLITTETWTGSGWAYTTTDQEFRFYYEVYFPTSVNHLTASGAAMHLYPVPAETRLNILLNTEKNTQFAFSIVDIKGSVISTWSDRVAGKYEKAITVDELPAGSYFIKAQSADAVHTERFIIRR